MKTDAYIIHRTVPIMSVFNPTQSATTIHSFWNDIASTVKTKSMLSERKTNKKASYPALRSDVIIPHYNHLWTPILGGC